MAYRDPAYLYEHCATGVKTDTQSRVSDAIHRARAYLLAQQNLEGYWWAELEANVTLTAEYVMLHRILIAADPRARFSNGKDREEQIRQMARYILRQQRRMAAGSCFTATAERSALLSKPTSR